MTGVLECLPVDLGLERRLSDRLVRIEAIFDHHLQSELPPVHELLSHVESYRGKMLRPMLVLVAGAAASRRDPDDLGGRHDILAAVLEMIHVATLAHDDVLDEADLRRRGPTINHLHGNESAVILGDYLLSGAFHLCSSLSDPLINLDLGRITTETCEGELVQLHHRGDWSLGRDEYLAIIERKTASLIGGCCGLSARLAGGDEDLVERLNRFGQLIGVAYQICDDILDLAGDCDVVGKTMGRDLAAGKVTLPIIEHLAGGDEQERLVLERLVDEGDVEGIRQRLDASGAIRGAEDLAMEKVEQATSLLITMPVCPARDLLKAIAVSVVDRSC